MSYATATQYWLALDPSQKQMFYDIASKSDGNHTAFEWFVHLVPDELKDDPSEVTTFMQGGTVITPDGDVHEIPDRDVSRITSGENGGEYTTENTIMEDSSVNRSRGADNMTEGEYADALEANAADTELIDAADTAVTDLSEAPDLLSEGLGTVAEFAVAGIAAYKVGEFTYKNLPSDWNSDDKALATAGVSAATAVAAFTPPGQIVIGVYAGVKLAQFGWNCLESFANWLNECAEEPAR